MAAIRALSADQDRSLSVVRPQAPVALTVRGPGIRVRSLAVSAGERVLLTGPDSDRSGSYARPPVALVICSVSQRASSETGEQYDHVGDVGRCPGGAARSAG